MERLPGLLAGEPVYWIEGVTALRDGTLRTQLGFSDVAAHPYEDLVVATVEMLGRLPSVEEVVQEDREVVEVTTRGLTTEQLGDIVDRFWFDRLPSAPIDPGFATDPAEVLVSPWPSTPPPPQGQAPAALVAAESASLAALRAAAALPPSRRRVWTYLVAGVVVLVGGAVQAVVPGGGNGVLLLVLGGVNTTIGIRIAHRRLRTGARLF